MKHSSFCISSVRFLQMLVVAMFLLNMPMGHTVKAQVINGVEYTIDTLENFVAGPSSEYFSLRFKHAATGERLDVYILRVDVRNPLVSFEQQLGKGQLVGVETPSSMAQRHTTDTKIAFGGTNGDFFITQGEVGRPTGLTIGNHEYAFIGSRDRHCAGITADGRPQIGIDWEYQGHLIQGTDTFKIAHINHQRKENELVLYNYHQGATTGTNEYGSEAVLSLLSGEQWKTNGQMKAKVEAVNVGVGDAAIEKDKFILSGHGTMKAVVDKLKVDDEVTIAYTLLIEGKEVNMAQCIGGDNYTNIILDNGEVPTSGLWDERHPRTGFGHSLTGDTVVMCVVDGRGKSWGCTTTMLGHIMHHYGAWRANNWDGGGSSCMYLQQFGQVNVGSDGHERATCNSMLAFANVPEKDETIAVIRPYASTLLLPKYGMHKPKFLGYNKYDVLLDTDVQGVTLTTDEASGYIEDGKFVCMGNGSFTAHYGDVTTTVQVRVKEGAEITFRLDSVLVSDDTNYPIEVLGIAGKNEVILQPAVLTWQVEDPAVCVIENGRLNGLQNGGRTRVFGTLGDFTDTLTVDVQIPDSKPLLLTNMSNAEDIWTIKTTPSSLKTEIRTSEDGKGIFWTNFTGGRAANTKFSLKNKLYSLPKFIEIRYNAQGFPISKIAFELQANNSQDKVNYTLEADALVLNEPTSIILDIDSILGVENDIAIYPVAWNYMTFFYDLQAEKKEYSMLFEGIYLHFAEIALGVDGTHLPSFSVYPNPVVDGYLTIANAHLASEACLYDLQGHVLMQAKITDATTQLNIEHLASGTYLLKVGNETMKVIKK